jgi:GT2 family glycosyltransferase
MRREIFFISGMHKSGISHLSLLIQKLLWGKDCPNLSGVNLFSDSVFENKTISKFHDKLIRSYDPITYHSPAASDNGSSLLLSERLFQELKTILASAFPGDGPIVISDPRLSLFLPLWTGFCDLMNFSDYYLFTLRYPIELISEQKKSMGITENLTRLVLVNYFLNSEEYSRKRKRTFLYFPEWYHNLDSTIDKIEKELDCSFAYGHLKNKSEFMPKLGLSNKHYITNKFAGNNNHKDNFSNDVFNNIVKLSNDAYNSSTLREIDNLRSLMAANSSHYLQRAVYLEDIRQFEIERKHSELEVKYAELLESYEKILSDYRQEQSNVFKPLYRSAYRSIGRILHKVIPDRLVEKIKSAVPNPGSAPLDLSFHFENINSKLINDIHLDAPTKDVKPDIFILSIINWDYRTQRPQHIAQGLSKIGHRIFYIEMSVAQANPQYRKIDDNVYVIRLPIRYRANLHAYTGKIDSYTARAWLDSFYAFCDSVNSTSFKHLIIQHPYWWQLACYVSPEFQIVYDCMDEISGFSNTTQHILDLEEKLITSCDKLIVTSNYLYDKYQNVKQVKLVRNAANLTHFDSAYKAIMQDKENGEVANNIGKFIKIGYVGAIAEWFDTNLIYDVALSRPELEIHICGSVDVKEPLKLNMLSNVHLHGEIPYKDVPKFIGDMDVMMIPFKVLPIIQACDPVKFYEYCAMGKPTVSTALPELQRVPELIFTANTPEEFIEQVQKANEKGKDATFIEELRNYALENTWHHRVSDFEETISNLPKVSVVILSFGDPELTKGTLHSLHVNGACYPNLEVIIVDNGSKEKDLASLKKYAEGYDGVRIIENGKNLGFAVGNNVGIKAASGDYILMLNNDTVVSRGAIYAMVRHLENNPDIGVVGPLTNNIGNEAKVFVDYQNMEEMRLVARQITTGYRGVFTPINVCAYFAAMLRRRDLDVFGLLSEDYGRGFFEDDDHCAIIKENNYTCALAEDAFIHHHLSASFDKVKKEERDKLFAENKQIYEAKWGEWRPHKYRENRPKNKFNQ